MAVLDKEIKIIAVKGERGTNGEDGKSSYDLAVEELHYSGTLEEWIASFSTPENYITRDEFKKVTQAEYDALEQAHQLIPDCYYIITDDETYDELLERLDGIDETIAGIQEDITTKYNARVYTKEVLLATPDLSDDTGWISFQSTAYQDWNFPLDNLENITDVLEIKGFIREKIVATTTYYVIREFVIRYFHRGTGYSSEPPQAIMYAGNVNTMVLIALLPDFNITQNRLEITPTIIAGIGSGTPLTTSDLDFKIVSVKELVNY